MEKTIVITLNGNVSDGKIELSWTIDDLIDDAEYEIFEKINDTFEKIGTTKNNNFLTKILISTI